MFRHIIPALAIVALLTGAASAQSLNLLSTDRSLRPEERQKQDAAERDYREATEKIPDRKASKDPWGNVRPEPSAAAKAKRP